MLHVHSVVQPVAHAARSELTIKSRVISIVRVWLIDEIKNHVRAVEKFKFDRGEIEISTSAVLFCRRSRQPWLYFWRIARANVSRCGK